MDAAQFLDAQFSEHAELVERTRLAVREPFVRLVGACVACLDKGGKILLFGNGGSAADAQHLAAELVVRYRRNRKALAAIALTTDTSILTACSNPTTSPTTTSSPARSRRWPGRATSASASPPRARAPTCSRR